MVSIILSLSSSIRALGEGSDNSGSTLGVGDDVGVAAWRPLMPESSLSSLVGVEAFLGWPGRQGDVKPY